MNYQCVIKAVLLVGWCVAHHLVKSSNVARYGSASNVEATSYSTVDVWTILCGQRGFPCSFQHLSIVCQCSNNVRNLDDF